MSGAKFDLVIRGGTVVSPDGAVRASLAIDGGIIVGIGDDDVVLPARETIDASGRHLLPGLIDCHVHLRDPGTLEAEDWQTGTASAACGGVTTVFDMPSTDPPVSNVANLALKQGIAAKKSYVDYGIYGLLGHDNLAELESLSDHGVVGFKCFMSSSLSGRLPPPDDGTLVEAFRTIAKQGKRCIVHAENLAIISYFEAKLKKEGRTDPRAHADSRPPVAAAEAVSRAIVFAEHAGMRLHIAHETSADALPYIAAARARGLDVTVETCPQYLLLTADDLAEKGGVLRCNPPIRNPGHDRALWQGIASGQIDAIATDHAPHLAAHKTKASIWDNHCGMIGLETAAPLMLTEVNRGRLSLSRYVELSAANPAKIWDLYPRKGALQVGSDADITIVDMQREGVIDQERLQSKCRISGWHGRKVQGMPVCTIVRGRIVMRDGRLEGTPGWGRPVRQHAGPPNRLSKAAAGEKRTPAEGNQE
ncbi:MAG: allantoinase AllB [Hyphomicrobiaceae bacterium]|nr:allantoinase AllB [Hyphomicrobiaceae bacterium]